MILLLQRNRVAYYFTLVYSTFVAPLNNGKKNRQYSPSFLV